MRVPDSLEKVERDLGAASEFLEGFFGGRVRPQYRTFINAEPLTLR